ncbi:DCA15 factor, partial [Bombycilla garrulus]|nr:DCA15 factor [Bombycilla garrulus]
QLSGQLSPRLFRKLPPRVCVTLKSIVDEEFLWAGHIFLGFSKCGRYVLSYTSSSGDDDFSFYLYHLYWWEFNVHSKLRLVRQVRLFQDEEIYSDLYLTVCEWPGDSDKVIVFGFNTRSAPGLQVNMMLMSDENHRDIYVSAVAVPPPRHCPACRRAAAPPGEPPTPGEPLTPRTPPAAPGSPPGEPQPPAPCPEPGYVNYTKLRYVLEPGEPPEGEWGSGRGPQTLGAPLEACGGAGRAPVTPGPPQGQYLTVEQLTLDFEYVINEVIRNDAAWSRQFCSFSDYDIVILEVCPETNQVVINIGLLLLAFPSPDEEGQLRPRTYHTSLKVAWDLNNGTFTTVGVGDLTEVKGQTSLGTSWEGSWGSEEGGWMSWGGSCLGVGVSTSPSLLPPPKGCSLKVLADNERYTWIVL